MSHIARPALYPGMTVNLWLRDLAPSFAGDVLDLGEADVTFTFVDRDGEIVAGPSEATLVGTSFRLVATLPETPGWYRVVGQAIAGGAVLTLSHMVLVEDVDEEWTVLHGGRKARRGPGV